MHNEAHHAERCTWRWEKTYASCMIQVQVGKNYILHLVWPVAHLLDCIDTPLILRHGRVVSRKNIAPMLLFCEWSHMHSPCQTAPRLLDDRSVERALAHQRVCLHPFLTKNIAGNSSIPPLQKNTVSFLIPSFFAILINYRRLSPADFPRANHQLPKGSGSLELKTIYLFTFISELVPELWVCDVNQLL